MADPTTTNMGLTVPTGGSTPGAANNTTPATYPYEWLGNLDIIDAHNHTSGSGVQVPSAGININGALSFNGYALTNGGAIAGTTGTFSGNSTVGGTFGVTGATSLAAMTATTGSLSSTLGVTGATTLSSTLGVTGAATLNSTCAITGNTTVGGTLGVTGATTLAGLAATTGAFSGEITATAASTGLAVTNNATIGGTLNVTGTTTAAAISATTLTASGNITLTSAMTITTKGHIIPSTSPGTPTAVTASGTTSTFWGLASGSSLTVTGTDAAFTLSITTGGSGQTSVTAQTEMFTVTLANSYSGTGFVCLGSYLSAASGTPGVSAVYCTITAGGTINVYNLLAFTPAATTTYKWQFITMGAGATS
jgi:fibronectin-binding autotransporter adhesin